ncbi:MAG: UDP-N-acetylmuramate dehydrogenase [Rikenellaceae bacterium]
MINREKNISLRGRNSFGIEAQCSELIEFDRPSDLAEIFAPGNHPQRWMVIGGGNNILFTGDYDGAIITSRSGTIKIESSDEQHAIIAIDGGADWDQVVEWSVQEGLWGLENLSLIPGTAGAAPIQNIGAYGVELSDTLLCVDLFDTSTLTTSRLSREECRLGYRDSIFKRELRGRVIITSIHLRLSYTPQPRLDYADLRSRVEERGDVTLRSIREVVCEIRNSKLPDPKELGNAGSFFKNPIIDLDIAEGLKSSHPEIPIYTTSDPAKVKIAAGWLIDHAGLKGLREGSVGMHANQALVMVNYGGATGAEIVAFARKVQRIVEERFGVAIDCEVNIV